ncbi:MAG: tRNA (N6-threonylcarbamoyladenosine(37)-N6)-methyltransferase TrmO [Anaerolineaceae bacterium]|nr:tRNA (N6-threonylcarbamoyladenosine(37)-N6)-methyltransferase TrmO [Anaerolineaceae bacterium]
MSYHMEAIGVIHSPFSQQTGTPIQSARSEAVGEVEVFAEFAEGLEGVEEFSHIYLLYLFDRVPDEIPLKNKPFLDDQEHGIFATRYPVRPNKLGFSVVKLLKREGNRLTVQGVDMLDGTPLLDIKPYFPDFDVFASTRHGWYEKRAYK